MSETKPITFFKREGVFIPLKSLKPAEVKRIEDKLTFKFYDEKACKQCEWLPERHCDMCDTCPAYKAGYQLSPKVKVGDNKYLKVPVGSYPIIQGILEDRGHQIVVKDKSKFTRIKPIKFLGKFKPGQKEAIDAMIRRKRGVIKAPPRSGKTVSSTAAICKIGGKTLIVASQREWLLGFQETFIGSKTKKAMTDLDPKRIKLCKTYEDFVKHDICLVTVQTLYKEKLLKKIKTMFSTIVVDEVHYGAADKYIQILAKLCARYFIGLSATPSRKDAKFVLVRHVIGPVIHEVRTERMRPRVRLTVTRFRKTYKGRPRWDQMVSSLENDPKRIELIAKTALRDLEAKHMILIPMSRVKAIHKMVDKINELAGKTVAFTFVGNLKKAIRDARVEGARTYKCKILVGTVKILSTGLNIPRASCLYEVSMSSNKENAEQRMARVLTPPEGSDKPDPVIRYFLDDMGVRKNCMRNEFYNVLVPQFKPIISERDKTMLEAYFRSKAGAGTSGKIEI